MATAHAAGPGAGSSLTGVRILELGGRDSAAQLCGRLLADAGAEVTAADAGPGPEDGDAHAVYEWRRRYDGKRVLRSGSSDLAALVDQADVVLADQDWIGRSPRAVT